MWGGPASGGSAAARGQDRSWLRPKSPSVNITPGKPTSSAKHFGGRRSGGGGTEIHNPEPETEKKTINSDKYNDSKMYKSKKIIQCLTKTEIKLFQVCDYGGQSSRDEVHCIEGAAPRQKIMRQRKNARAKQRWTTIDYLREIKNIVNTTAGNQGSTANLWGGSLNDAEVQSNPADFR